ncbi:MAG: ATP-binding cassette domain-containing protein [Bacillota bacterium]
MRASEAPAPTFEIERLARSYGHGPLALDLDLAGESGGGDLAAPLAIGSGVVNVVLGPNGSGKTTLLRLLSLIDRPTAARGRVFGLPWPWPGNGNGDGDRAAGDPGEALRVGLRRRMALIFQRPVLFEGSVAGNVGYGLTLRGWTVGSPEWRRRVEESLEAVGLAGLADRPAKGLSSGESQRVALARALACRPDVYLLDEPTANLDPGSAAAIERLVLALRDEGRTVVLITHNLFQAKRLAGRVLFLSEGRLVEDAPAAVFFERPASEPARAFVAGETTF